MPPTTRWVGVPGTWGSHSEHRWWDPTSPFALHLRSLGFLPLRSNPFVWSTELDGTFLDLFRSKNGRHSDWDAAGAALAYYLRYTRFEDRNVIAHSHGLQVVLYACGRYGLRLNTLVSVGSPVRADLDELAQAARRHIGYWTHVYSDSSDRWQWLGALFDGHFGIVRKQPRADLNISFPRVGHTKLLTDPNHFSEWVNILYPSHSRHRPGSPHGL